MRDGWQIKSLGEMLFRTETIDPTRSPNEEFVYIDVSSVSNETLSIQEVQRLKGADAPSRARKQVRANDVLFATIRPTLRRIAIVPCDLDGEVCSTGYFVLRPKPEVDPRFVYYFLQTAAFMSAMESLQKGASYPAVTDGDVRSQSLAFPSLSEQKRIVAILEEAFEGIASAKTNAERNIQNASALFESLLQSTFSRRGNGWIERRLEEVFTIGSSKRVYEKDWTKSGIPFYGGREVVRLAQSGEAMANAYISEERYEEIASVYGIPVEGDILMTARGTIGVGYIVRAGDRFYYKDGNLMCLHPIEPTDPNFVLYAFRSRTVLDQLAKLTGATVTHLPIEKAQSLLLAFPPIADQKRVVSELREIELETNRLSKISEQKLAALDDLKKSLLHHAFSGQL